MSKPLVALVGRPNVGKSTLFNRLAGERLAVVDEAPGTTRDRLVADAEWNGIEFAVVDTGGIDPAAGTTDDYASHVRAQAEAAVEAADAVVLITDVASGPLPADHEVAQLLRRYQGILGERSAHTLFLAVNKCDNEARRREAVAFYELGLGTPHPISALHGQGIGDLLDSLVGVLTPAEPETVEAASIAIVGRPNVGKSSLLNRLLGEERVIVSPIPGTTRDAVDTWMTVGDTRVRLVDTAGIRRRGRIIPGVEKYSVLRTLKAIERSDVALLMIDAVDGITAQDAHVAGMILDAAKSVVLLVNKWDAAPKDGPSVDEATHTLRQRLNFLDHVPVLFISALTGRRVADVLPMALKVHQERLVRIPTADLNRLLRDATAAHPPPSKAGRPLKIYYASQVRTDPPTFLVHVNDPTLVHFSYRRYLENRLRERYPFAGTPLRFSFRARGA